MQSIVSEVRSCLCLEARRTARHLTQLYDEALRPSGLKVTQFQLLAAVGAAEPVTQQTLVKLMGMDRTTLTRNLALLQRDGLLEIVVGPRDRREHVHRLTAPGRKAVATAMPFWRAIHQKLLEHLGAGSREAAPTQVQQLFDHLGSFTG